MNKKAFLGGAGGIAAAALAGAFLVGGNAMEVNVEDVNPGGRVERSLCLTVAMLGGAAECGDLRLAHSLPGVRTMGQDRVPLLVYNSQHAHPHPIVAANVTLPDGNQGLDRVVATLKVAGVPRARSVWRGAAWPGSAAARIAVGYDAERDVTGVQPYTLEVVAHYGGSEQKLIARGDLVVINRRASPYGAGWAVAGIERLHMDRFGNPVLWEGEDGSFRRYVRANDTTWSGPALDRPDTLRRAGSGFARILPGGTRILFDAAGRHTTTLNRMKQETRVEYDGAGRLARITVPPRIPIRRRRCEPGWGDFCQELIVGWTAHQYRFTYGPQGRLSRIEAPDTGDAVRTVRVHTSGARVDSITEPDGRTRRFGYTGADTRVTWVTDRAGVVTLFRYDAGGRLSSARLNLATGDSIVPRLRSTETLGLADADGRGAVDTSKVYTLFDGARTDLRDTASFRLGRWGEPRRIVDALGHETRIVRDVRFPALVAETRNVRGLVTRAWYNDRGDPDSVKTISPYGDGRDPTTRYGWDPRWGVATRIEQPEGEVATIKYDSATGNRLWQQAGSNPDRRVRYTYESGDLAGLLASGTAPGATRPDSVSYDDMGNVRLTVTPGGLRTEYYKDRLGRDTLVISPIDATHSQRTRTRYRAGSDWVEKVETSAPVMAGASPEALQTLHVFTEYDEEGRQRKVTRWTDPNPAGISRLTTEFRYDRAGRPTAEVAADGAVDSTHYDPAGNVDTMVTRRGLIITAEYDALNRVLRRRLPEVRYAARAEGIGKRAGASGTNRHASTYPRYPGGTSEGSCFGEPAAARPACGLVIPASVTEFDYDESGNVTRADNADARVSRTYYPGGALKTETQHIRTLASLAEGGDFDQHVYTMEYVYDRNGRRTELRHPQTIAASASPTRYAYHEETGDLLGVTDPLQNSFTYTYHISGAPESLTRPGGIVERFAYDAEGQLERNWLTGKVGESLRDVDFSYDRRGKLLGSVNKTGKREVLNATYTGLGHLRVADNLYPGTDAQTQRTGKYTDLSESLSDPMGNLTSLHQRTTFKFDDNSVRQWNWSNSAMAYEQATGRLMARLDGPQLEETSYDSAGNIVFSTSVNTSGAQGLRQDRAQYYDAQSVLRVVDFRRQTQVVKDQGLKQNDLSPYYIIYEEYRYDAFGRRVWVRTRRECFNDTYTRTCSRSDVRRVVWDGDSELYEIQMPGGDVAPASLKENDTQPVPNQGSEAESDLNLQYGRVLYTYGNQVDKPLSVTRMLYADRQGAWPGAFMLAPHWTVRGQAEAGTFASGDRNLCQTISGVQRCVAVDWPQGWFPYSPLRKIPENWHGTLLAEKQDATDLMYRRNRYYDPASGRFTQEDPIGLAGGLNLYGFADGDPVSYSDPFGLEPCSILPWSSRFCTWADVRRNASEWLHQDDGNFWERFDQGLSTAAVVVPQFAAGMLRPVGTGSFRAMAGEYSRSEYDAAMFMARRGNSVILRTPRGPRAGGGTSDLLVNGRTYDVITPITTNPDRVISGMAKKNSQAVGIVLDLRHTTVTRAQLRDYLARVRGAGATRIVDIQIMGGN